MFWVHRGRLVDKEMVGRAAAAGGIPLVILAAPANAGANQVNQSLQPVINLLQDLAEPIAYAFMIYGGIQYIAGKSSEGKRILKDAAGGYILIQWIPWLFSIIRTIR